MLLPFETHNIYITLDDDKFYQLNSDYTKTEINISEIITGTLLLKSSNHPFMVIHKQQFQYGKFHLMSKENPMRISNETAEIYHKIGFLSKEELETYIQI